MSKYGRTNKNYIEKWACLESQKIIRVGDYLLGSVTIPETHPFLFGLTMSNI